MGNMLKEQYDKILAVAMVVVLAVAIVSVMVWLGGARGDQESFRTEINGMQPLHPEAARVDVAPYEIAKAMVEQPPQIASWTNASFVPELRVWCVDCKRPILWDAKKCPFCNVVQPEDRESDPGRDLDADSMKDVWELAHGLDPADPQDAAMDPDKDGFTNYEESQAGTDPRDSASMPSIISKLYVKDTKAEPFQLLFKSRNRLPDGSWKYALNTRQNQTFFVKLGQTVQGFKVSRFDEKWVEKDTNTGKRRFDESVLTLSRTGKMIPLVMGQPRSYSEVMAVLVFSIDGSEFTVKQDERFVLRGEKYKLVAIDTGKGSVVIERETDGSRLTINRSPNIVKTSEEGSALQ
jgi:hypothetical protein